MHLDSVSIDVLPIFDIFCVLASWPVQYLLACMLGFGAGIDRATQFRCYYQNTICIACFLVIGISLWRYVYFELTRGYWLEHDKARFAERRKRVYTFMKIPRELEKFITYGFFQCVDGFLFIFTFLPLRFIKAVFKFCVRGFLTSCWPTSEGLLDAAEICDLLKGIVLIICCVVMHYIDVSMMYHIIRGQTVIKLYIFFNMLDIADKLFSSFGQDILDSLFWTAAEPRGRRREHIGVLPHLALAVVYVFMHSILVLFQANTLNVAFNSHNKSLLTIMMSNNFVELKGSVFKKFEKHNLFQMSCSDVRERFHLLFLLTVVGVRNLTEFAWNLEHFWVLVPDMILVMLSEFVVDWVKHAFITKFNEIPSEVYREYTLSIAYDLASSRHTTAFSDHLDTMSRRMGFVPLPLAVLLIRVVTQSLRLNGPLSYVIVVVLYLCLLSFKVLIGIILLGKAHQSIDENNRTVRAKDLASQQSDVKPMSKDDLDLLSVVRSSPTVAETTLLRRTQSLSEFASAADNTAMADLSPEKATSSVQSLADIPGFPLQGTFVGSPLLDNSTVSLQSVQLNTDFVDNRIIRPRAVSDVSELDVTITDGGRSPRHRQRSECTDGTVTPPLSEVTRYTMCANRII